MIENLWDAAGLKNDTEICNICSYECMYININIFSVNTCKHAEHVSYVRTISAKHYPDDLRYAYNFCFQSESENSSINLSAHNAMDTKNAWHANHKIQAYMHTRIKTLHTHISIPIRKIGNSEARLTRSDRLHSILIDRNIITHAVLFSCTCRLRFEPFCLWTLCFFFLNSRSLSEYSHFLNFLFLTWT